MQLFKWSPSRFYRFVDDKLAIKRIWVDIQIQVGKLHEIVKNKRYTESFAFENSIRIGIRKKSDTLTSNPKRKDRLNK